LGSEKDRVNLHTESNARVAEYWRRLDVAGFSPFCALGSWEDGNHWFLDSLKFGKPKPVWEGLRTAYAPQSVSLEIWDRNFMPLQEFSCPLHFFNESPDPLKMKALLCLFDSSGKQIWADTIRQKVPEFGHETFPVEFMMPNLEGRFVLKAILIRHGKRSAESVWPIRILEPKRRIADNLRVSTLAQDPEIGRFSQTYFNSNLKEKKGQTKVLICRTASFNKLNQKAKDSIQDQMKKGLHLILLDAGPKWLGAGYPEDGNENPYQAQPTVALPKKDSLLLPFGVKVQFTQTAEPESHIHSGSNTIWKGLGYDYAWLWNGYRGGLVVPAADMEIQGLGTSSFKTLWHSRGADTSILSKGLYAYELQGFYDFSLKPGDALVQKRLREKVAFLVADAPALKGAINLNGRILETNLKTAMAKTQNAQGEEINILARCGKNLVRSPLVEVGFGKGKGKLLISQLLMEGRLEPNFQNQNVYGVRKDPVAIQMLINRIEELASP
jgi:hypothetical protein